jgi:hypothetical protein
LLGRRSFLNRVGSFLDRVGVGRFLHRFGARRLRRSGAPFGSLGPLITITMLRPSCLGCASTTAVSPRSSTNRSKILRPRSVWAISRPRNMMVTLTRAPAERNRMT